MAPSVTIQNADTRSQSQLKQNIPNKDHSSAKRVATQPKPPQQKKISRRSSKPIIDWFQRKLAATVKPRRVAEAVSRGDTEDRPGRGKARVVPTAGVRAPNRVSSSPLPINGSTQKNSGKQQHKWDNMTVARRKTISLNGDDDGRDFSAQTDGDRSSDGSSLAHDSTWSPTSVLEADEDASLRPIPPSAPPSPSPSRSSSSYLSDPRTFRSMAASTKPTTLLSVDLTPNGMAHIAQVPVSQVARIPPHIRTSSTNTTPGLIGSGTSVTFSALPPSPQSSRPSSLRNPASIISSNPSSQQQTTPQVSCPISPVQAPLHTTHHPRNNPRPSSPPLDNASMLTLASSAFAMPGSRVGVAPGWSSSAPSAIGWDDSLSHLGGSIAGDGYPDESTSQFVMGDDDRLEERDVDASVRALRPRSSRRGSWGSEASGWSARVHGLGTSSLARERSLWTTNSVRTGGQFTADNETGERSTENDGSGEPSPSEAHPEASSPHISEVDEAVLQSCTLEPTSRKPDVPTLAPPVFVECTHSTDTVALTTPNKDLAQDHDATRLDGVEDDHNLTLDKEVWHSAPSTPLTSGLSD